MLKELNDYEPSLEDLAEQIAFEFVENYTNKETGWGTYYGPMMVFPEQQNQMVEYPSIQKLTLDTLNYWHQRSKETKNPVLSARYADLILDFHKKVSNKNPEKIIEYKSGKVNLLGLFVGEVMKLGKGKADPKMANQLVKEALEK